MTIKVLHLISGGDKGGARTHIYTLMEGLKNKVDAKIVCFIDDTFYEEAKSRGIDIEVFPQNGRADMSVVDRLSKLINSENYDIVHSHGARANSISSFLKRRVDVPFITTMHSDYLLDFKGSFYKNLIYTPINKFSLKKFDYYIAITENFKKTLVERGFPEDKIYVLYNGIEMSPEDDIIPKDEFLMRNGIVADGKFLVGHVARQDPVKNVEMTIKAANIVLQNRQDVMFLLAGEGSETERLKELVNSLNISDNVKFLGFVKENMSFFNAIDLNLLTSESESFPYAILESSKMRVPTIATAVGGIPEMIRYGEDGLLVRDKDYTDLSQKILYLMEDRDLLKKMGDKAYNRVLENFSMEAMANRQVEIYKMILGDKND